MTTCSTCGEKLIDYDECYDCVYKKYVDKHRPEVSEIIATQQVEIALHKQYLDITYTNNNIVAFDLGGKHFEVRVYRTDT